jgi:hypothetical protein
MSLCDGCIHFFLFLVKDDDVLEVRVGGVEVATVDGAVEWEPERLIIRVLVVEANSTVAERLVIVRLEIMFALLDVGCQDNVEGENLASLLASRNQQALGVATVVFSLQQLTKTELIGTVVGSVVMNSQNTRCLVGFCKHFWGR